MATSKKQTIEYKFEVTATEFAHKIVRDTMEVVQHVTPAMPGVKKCEMTVTEITVKKL